MTKTAWISCLLLFGHAGNEFAQTNNNSQMSSELESRRARYVLLDRQIFAQHADPDSEKNHISQPDKVAEIGSQLRKLLSDEIDSVLLGPGFLSEQGKRRYYKCPGRHGAPVDDMTNTPFASPFVLSGVPGFAIAYAILEGGEIIPDTQPYLVFYDRSNGRFEMKAEAPTLLHFRARTFFVSQMDSGIPGEAWFLAWGMTVGNPGTPVNVRLYWFCGNAVRTVWKRDGLTARIVTARKNSVTLEYDWEYKSNDRNNRVRETLHVTANELE